MTGVQTCALRSRVELAGGALDLGAGDGWERGTGGGWVFWREI